MTARLRKVSKAQAEEVLALVRAHYRESGETCEGLSLNMRWDWCVSPTPTLLWEGGPDCWATRMSIWLNLREGSKVFAEPWSSYALCLYPPDQS